MQKITENVVVQYGVRSANVGIIRTSEGLIMVETPMIPEDAVKLRTEISEMGKIKYLINTEPHQDHFSGNYYFEGTVVSHEGTRQEILRASMDQFKGMLQMSAPGVTLEKDYYFRPPTITFSQRLTLHLGKHTIELINLPGHTPSETAVYIPEEQVVFTGDNVVRGSMPFLHQAVPYAWLDSLKQLEQLDVDFIIPGHGEVSDKRALKEMSANISDWIEVVKNAVEKGWSLEEAHSRINMLDKYAGDKQRMSWVQKINIENLYKILNARK
jgi:cyclase